jgi:hypothetical protein
MSAHMQGLRMPAVADAVTLSWPAFLDRVAETYSLQAHVRLGSRTAEVPTAVTAIHQKRTRLSLARPLDQPSKPLKKHKAGLYRGEGMARALARRVSSWARPRRRFPFLLNRIPASPVATLLSGLRTSPTTTKA